MSQDTIKILNDNPFNFATLPTNQLTEENALHAIRISQLVFHLLPENLHTTKVCLAAIDTTPISSLFRENGDEVLIGDLILERAASEKCCVENLQFMSIQTQTTELCIKALKLNPSAIKYIKNFNKAVTEYVVTRIKGIGDISIMFVYEMDVQYQTLELWENVLSYWTPLKTHVKYIRPDLLNKLSIGVRNRLISTGSYIIKYFETYTQNDFVRLVTEEGSKCPFCVKKIDRSIRRVDNCNKYCSSKKYFITQDDKLSQHTSLTDNSWRLLEYCSVTDILPFLDNLLKLSVNRGDLEEIVLVLELHTKDVIRYLLTVTQSHPNIAKIINHPSSIILKVLENVDTPDDTFVYLIKLLESVQKSEALKKLNKIVEHRGIGNELFYKLSKIFIKDNRFIERPAAMSPNDYYELIVKCIVWRSVTEKEKPSWIKDYGKKIKDNENNVITRILKEVYEDCADKIEVVKEIINQVDDEKILEPPIEVKLKLNDEVPTGNTTDIQTDPNVLSKVQYVVPEHFEVFNPFAPKTYNKYVRAVKQQPEFLTLVPMHLITANMCKIALDGGCDKDKIPVQYRFLLKCYPDPASILLIQYNHTKTVTSTCEKWNWRETQSELEERYKVRIIRKYKKSNKLCFYTVLPKFIKVAQAVFYTN